MLINPPNPIFQTEIFSAILLAAIFLTFKKNNHQVFLPRHLTDELKGIAILMIIFSHIGYYLSSDTKFLFPLSVFAGVGVNLFFLLSGFGLTSSSLIKTLSPLSFYKKRLSKLYIPLWFVLAILLLFDFFILGKGYSLTEIVQAFLGFFPNANLYVNLDSPLWYFSMILFYYLVFPIFFIKKFHWFSPLLIFLVTFILTEKYWIAANPSVMALYKVHLVAFPLGMFLALLKQKYLNQNFFQKINFKNSFSIFLVKMVLATALFLIICYTAINSGIGNSLGVEQAISLLTTLSAVLFFNLLNFEFRFFNFFGMFSYEIYLFHWPLVYQFGFLYKTMPAFLATILYLGLFLILGFALQKLLDYLTSFKIFWKSSG